MSVGPKTRRFLVITYLIFLGLQLPFYAWVGFYPFQYDALLDQGEDLLKENDDPARFEQARELFKQALAVCVDGDLDDARMGMCYYNIGAMHWAQGQLSEAQTHFWKALEIFRQTNGPDSYYCGVVRARLGEIDMQLLRYVDAHQKFSRSLPAISQYLGPKDGLYLRIRAKSGLLAYYRGDFEEARRILEQTLPLLRRDEKAADERLIAHFDAVYQQLKFRQGSR